MPGFDALYRASLEHFGHEPLEEQDHLLRILTSFALERSGRQALIVSGYAGTGKTSLMAAFVNALHRCGMKYVLLAPTGRAAKVFSSYAGFPAYTIHKRLFRGTLPSPGGELFLAPNNDTDTLFIVDEASMIPEGEGGHILSQLLRHIYSAYGNNVIFVGDTAQLPPVGQPESFAMNPEALRRLGLQPECAYLDRPVRQARRSGILYNATWLRRAMLLPQLPAPQMKVSSFPDVEVIGNEYLGERIADSFSATGDEGTMVVTRSNFRAGLFNRQIRACVFYAEEQLQRGEKLVVVKNNYFYSDRKKDIDFLANGEIVRLEYIHGMERRYGLDFADVDIYLPVSGKSLTVKILLDCLISDAAALTAEQSTALYNAVLAEYTSSGLELSKALLALRRDPYLNALQVKYAYCLTCHKAQGGQWDNLFVDLGGIAAEDMGMEFYRWLYTAVTRARKRLYLVNPTLKIL